MIRNRLPTFVAILAVCLPASASDPSAQPASAEESGSGGSQSAAPSEPSPEAERALFMARLEGLYEGGVDDVVIEDGEERLESSPSDVPLRNLVARALARTAARSTNINEQRSLYLRAMNHLLAARAVDPGSTVVRVDICNIHFIMGRHSSLVAEIESLLHDQPENENLRDIVSQYADQYISDGDPDRASQVYGIVASAWPQSPTIAANHGTVLLLTGRLQDGLRALKRAASLDPTNADTAHDLARAHLYAGDRAGALAWFETAHELLPEQGRFVLDLAVFRAHASPEEAKPLFREAMKILGVNKPQQVLVGNLASALTEANLDVSGLAGLARDLDQAGYPVYAMAAIEMALDRDPGSAVSAGAIEPLLLRAAILVRQRFYVQALADYRRARDLLPAQPESTRAGLVAGIVSGIARSHVGLGEPRQALEVLKAAGPPESFPFENAEALLQIGDVSTAVALLKQVARLEYDPQRAEAAKKRLREISGGQRR